MEDVTQKATDQIMQALTLPPELDQLRTENSALRAERDIAIKAYSDLADIAGKAVSERDSYMDALDKIAFSGNTRKNTVEALIEIARKARDEGGDKG